MSTILLNKDAVNNLLNMAEVMKAVEDAFMALAQDKASMPPKAYLPVEQGDFRAMPAAIPGAAGMKWVNAHPQNPSLGLPTVMAVLIYNDPKTGYPLAIMDATEITAYRTAATAAIASKYLARPDSHVLGIIGAGHQAYTQILAHVEVFKLKTVRIYDQYEAASKKLISSFPGYPLVESSLEDTAASDIVCTLTPSRTPIVKKQWILPGTHINAVGADAAGKEELEPSILKDAVVVVDDLRQAGAAGEINVPVSQGLYTVDEVHATLSELIIGRKQGRTDGKQVTVFDSTGIAIEDIATAKLICEKAKEAGNYSSIDLL